MFRCDHCKTEYGGIRGVTADRCPRCAAEGVATRRPAHLTAVSPAPWHPLQLATASWSQLSSLSSPR
jgi:hypothetical protein